MVEKAKPIKVQAPEKPIVNYSSSPENFPDLMPDIQEWGTPEYFEQASHGKKDS